MDKKEALARVKAGNFNGYCGFDMQLLVDAVGTIGEMLKSGQLKEQEAIEPKFKKLRVPEKCRRCRSCQAADTRSLYCRVEAGSSLKANPQMDLSSVYVNADSRPVWCPIIKMNEELDRMPFEKRVEFEKLITWVSLLPGGKDLWE